MQNIKIMMNKAFSRMKIFSLTRASIRLTCSIAKIFVIPFLILSLSNCATQKKEVELNTIRYAALKETATSISAQTALYWSSQNIHVVLKNESRQLDRIFNFNAMLLPNNVLPPVLSEEVNTLTLDNDNTIRLSDRDYQIVAPARFVTAAPTWRDYLWMPYKKPDSANHTLLPKNEIEKNIWNKYVKIGWKAGLDQANDIFSSNLNRLVRDFNGLVLYRKLYAQHIVSAPFVSQADLGITGGGDKLRINDRVLRIAAISELNPNSKQWRPVLSSPPAKQKGRKEDTYNKYQKNREKIINLKDIIDKLPR